MTAIAQSDVRVTKIGLTAKWSKQTMQLFDWGLLLGDRQIAWATIDEVKLGKAKTNGGFRLRADQLKIEVTFANPWMALAGVPAIMVDGARQDDLRLAWVHTIVERAGLELHDGRLWTAFRRPQRGE